MTRDQFIGAMQSAIVNHRALGPPHPAGQAVMTVEDFAVALEAAGLIKFDAGVPVPTPAAEFADIVHSYFGIGAKEASADVKSIMTELERRGVKLVRDT